MLENIKAVLFDLDGTLIDSMTIWKEIDQEFLRNRHLAYPDDLEKAIEGMSMMETATYFIDRFALEYCEDELYQLWNDMAYDYYRNRITFKPGAKEFLLFLRKKQIKTAIATSNSRELVDAVYENLSLDSYIDLYVTSHEVKMGKPAPDVYLLAAERLGVKPENCLVFEDLLAGIESAHAAGMKACAVYDVYSVNDDKAKQEAAEYYIRDYNNLIY